VTLAADLPKNPPASDPDPASYDLLDEAVTSDHVSRAAGRNPIGVKFSPAGKIALYDAGDGSYRVGEGVVVAADRGHRIGTVALMPLTGAAPSGSMRKVLRRPNRHDRQSLADSDKRADELLRKAKAVARDLKLAAKLFRAELGQGGSKVQIYLSSDEKVDTRRLAQELTRGLGVRVDLRQTGARDEAKMVGGIGSCGQELCCTTWLPAFVPVSIKHAKDQGLVLNPTKVSGQCGRLKCCLVYEQETYAAMRKGLPKLGKRVTTEAGEGRVVEVDVLRQRIRVSLAQGDVQVFAADQVKPLFAPQPPPTDPRGSR